MGSKMSSQEKTGISLHFLQGMCAESNLRRMSFWTARGKRLGTALFIASERTENSQNQLKILMLIHSKP